MLTPESRGPEWVEKHLTGMHKNHRRKDCARAVGGGVGVAAGVHVVQLGAHRSVDATLEHSGRPAAGLQHVLEQGVDQRWQGGAR